MFGFLDSLFLTIVDDPEKNGGLLLVLNLLALHHSV
jgi:hypothetical protein